jgi:hypothetical protein
MDSRDCLGEPSLGGRPTWKAFHSRSLHLWLPVCGYRSDSSAPEPEAYRSSGFGRGLGLQTDSKKLGQEAADACGHHFAGCRDRDQAFEHA